MRFPVPHRPCIAALLAASLAACASVPAPLRQAPPTYARHIADADAALVLGQSDLAITALERAAQADPSRKEPWLRLARLHAQAGRHGAAAHAADEALQRDPQDAEAQALVMVGSLQLAADTLDRARRDGWAPAPKPELERLVRNLRVHVGEEALIPERTRAELQALRARLDKLGKCVQRDPEAPTGDPFRALGTDDTR